MSRSATAAARVAPGSTLALRDRPSRDDGGLTKEQGRDEFRRLHRRLIELEELLYADGRFGLLVVLQGMDTAGKDSTVRAVFSGVCPTGMRVASFKAPTPQELAHDFLWRVHPHTPARGQLVVFNRSHYEDVLIVRVKQLVPEAVWRARYEIINSFEHALAAAGTTIVKCFLHISKDYQKSRLQRRLDNPSKHWKFNPDDLKERARWDAYQQAYEEALSRCSTEHAPWYVIPAERRWYRNLLIMQILVETLESLELRYPKPTFDAATIKID